MDLALNNLQRLICHKTQQTKPTKPIISYRNGNDFSLFFIIFFFYLKKAFVFVLATHTCLDSQGTDI